MYPLTSALTHHGHAGSPFIESKFFYHGVGEQFPGELFYPGQSPCVGRPAQFYLEPLALAHANHVAESQPLAGA